MATDPRDNKTLYYGEDEGDGSVYKFVADKEGGLSTSKLYVLFLDFTCRGGDPKGNTGKWVLVPNTTIAERNDTKKNVMALDASGRRKSGAEIVTP